MMFALLFATEEGPGHENAPSMLQDIVPSNFSSATQSMMVQVDRALSICARKTGYLQCWQSGVQQTNGERAWAVGTDHERLFDVGGFRGTGDENAKNRLGEWG